MSDSVCAPHVNAHLAQIETGQVGIALRIDLVGRVETNGYIAWHGRAKVPRVMHDERAVDAPAE